MVQDILGWNLMGLETAQTFLVTAPGSAHATSLQPLSVFEQLRPQASAHLKENSSMSPCWGMGMCWHTQLDKQLTVL